MSVEHIEQQLTATVNRISEAPHQDASDKIEALPIGTLKTYLGDLLTALVGVQAETGPEVINTVLRLDLESEFVAKDVDRLVSDVDTHNPDLIAVSEGATGTSRHYQSATYGVSCILNIIDAMAPKVQALLGDIDRMAVLQGRASASIDKGVQSTAATEAATAAYLHTVTGK